MIADRLYSKLKPVSEAVVLSKPLNGSLADNARVILELTSAGELSPDTAKELLGVLADVGRIIEVSELETRIQALEHQRGSDQP